MDSGNSGRVESTYILLKATSGAASLNSSLPISLSSRFITSPEDRTTPVIGAVVSILSLLSLAFQIPNITVGIEIEITDQDILDSVPDMLEGSILVDVDVEEGGAAADEDTGEAPRRD